MVQSGTGFTKELDMPKDKEYQKFLKRVVAVLGDETVQTMNSQQATVLQEALADFWEWIQIFE